MSRRLRRSSARATPRQPRGLDVATTHELLALICGIDADRYQVLDPSLDVREMVQEIERRLDREAAAVAHATNYTVDPDSVYGPIRDALLAWASVLTVVRGKVESELLDEYMGQQTQAAIASGQLEIPSEKQGLMTATYRKYLEEKVAPQVVEAKRAHEAASASWKGTVKHVTHRLYGDLATAEWVLRLTHKMADLIPSEVFVVDGRDPAMAAATETCNGNMLASNDRAWRSVAMTLLRCYHDAVADGLPQEPSVSQEQGVIAVVATSKATNTQGERNAARNAWMRQQHDECKNMAEVFRRQGDESKGWDPDWKEVDSERHVRTIINGT